MQMNDEMRERAADQATYKAKETMRLQRRREVWRLRCLGWSQQRIADEVGVNQATISRDLAWATKEAMKGLTDWVRRVKVEQVHLLEHIVDECVQAWERSKGTVSKSSVRRKSNELGVEVTGEPMEIQRGGIGEIVTSVTEAQLLGDEDYLQEARAAMADIRAIVGANAPILHATDVTMKGRPIVVREVVVEIPESAVKGDDEAAMNAI